MFVALAMLLMMMSDERLIPPQFDRYHVVMMLRGDKADQFSDQERHRLQNEHLAYLKKLYLDGELLAMGPFQVEDSEPNRGLMLFRGDLDIDRVHELVGDDPSIKAGRLGYRTFVWLTPKGALAPGSRPGW